MSWLDDMEAADPAYPDPDTDPWIAGVPKPGVGHSQPVGRAFTADETYRVAEDGVGSFLEYRDTHGYAEDEARAAALGEVAEAIHTWAADEALHPHHAIDRDRPQIRAAEVGAREAGLQATIPQPGGQGSPGYEADAGAWGSGLGVSADGPEAGE